MSVFLVLLQCICILRVVFSYFGCDLSSCDVSLIVQIFFHGLNYGSVYCHLPGCPSFVLSNVESCFNRHNELSALGGGGVIRRRIVRRRASRV